MWNPPSGSPAGAGGDDVRMGCVPVRRPAGAPRIRVSARSFFLLAALAVAISACRREPAPEETGAMADSLAAAVHRAEGGPELPAAEGAGMREYGDTLRFEVDVPQAVVLGAEVPIEVRLTNIGSEPITLTLAEPEAAFDVEVRDEAGEVVWRRLEGQAVARDVQTRVLAPGETLTLRDTWPQRTNAGAPVAEGSYLVMASVAGPQPEPIRTRARLLRIAAP